MDNSKWPSRRQVVAGAGTLAAGLTTFAATVAAQPKAQGIVFHDRSGSGRRQPGDPGIAHVLVSNGVDVVRTDYEGRWQLPVHPGNELFVIKPPGWSVPQGRLGLMNFSQCVSAPSIEAVSRTNPRQSIDFALRPTDEKDAFDVALVADTQPQSDLELDYLRDSTLAAIAQTGAAFAINHGDVVFDDATLYPRYLQLTAATGMPWHHCPGNHDMNRTNTVADDCFETWRAVFGPTSYAFQYGRATFIMLNNVERLQPGRSTASGYDYRGAIGDRQMQFIRNLLAHVPFDDLVVVSMHIPLLGFEDPSDPAGRTADHHALMRLLSGRPHTVSFAGHTHTTEHHYLGASHGFDGPGLHHHHVLTTACGSWWSGPIDHQGQPLASNRDGSPKGFHILSVNSNRYTTRLVPVGHSGHPQMRISLAGQQGAELLGTTARNSRSISLPVGSLGRAAVVVNVFDGGPHTKVNFSVHSSDGDDVVGAASALPMQRVMDQDPYTVTHYALYKSELKPWVEPTRSSHIWRATLPSNLAPGVYRICATARDEYNRSHATATLIEITSRLEM